MSTAPDVPRPSTPPAPRGADDLAAEVLAGLSQRPKRLAPRWFYDECGSRLFERICELPEYHLTRTETAILARHAADIAAFIGPRALLVEYGSGASTKTRLLLDCLEDAAGYVPVDISRRHLLAAARAIAASYPGLDVLPLCADFTLPLALPVPKRNAQRIALFFPGSTLGNFDDPAARELLAAMRASAGRSGCLVLGADLVRDPARLRRAYDDSQGVTAEFNRNALLHLNRRLGTDFDPRSFRHEAAWNEAQQRVELRLVATRAQTIHLGGQRVAFGAGEALVTEHCRKYTIESCTALARTAGWSAGPVFTDARRDFAVLCFEAGAGHHFGRGACSAAPGSRRPRRIA